MRETTDVDSRASVGGYWVGQDCTFHSSAMDTIRVPICPYCGGVLKEVAPHTWRAEVVAADRKQPSFEAMMLWSYGMCFPDQDTLQNAYRQAMEGE